MLVTNTRDFVLLGENAHRATQPSWRPSGWPTPPPISRRSCNTPAPLQTASGRRWPSTWARALAHRAALAEPRDLARLLASYARDGLARVETHRATRSSLNAVRSALEEALGVKLRG